MFVENPDDLAYEAATNRRYLTALREKAVRAGRPAVSASANERWLGRAPRLGTVAFGPLVGRVGLATVDEDLGHAFYIGARYLSDFDHPVVSWDAPISRIFFDPADAGHELASCVLVRRTLLERLDEIVKVHDVWEVSVDPTESPFRQKLAVPSAPRPPQDRRARSATPPLQTPPKPRDESGPAPEEGCSEDATSEALRPSVHDDLARLHAGMRSVEAVHFALAAPRSEALTSVLSTLQPDQYRIVTQPGEDPLIVQGHPGTGKTIIGAHRAAYLVSMERPAAQRAGRVLFLGPSNDWVLHVSGLIRTLDTHHRVELQAAEYWLREVANLKGPMSGQLDGTMGDVGRFVRGVLDRAAALSKEGQPWATGRESHMRNLERLYNIVRNAGLRTSRLKLGAISTDWVKTLPPFGEAVRLRRYLPLFAQASLSIQGGPAIRYDHIVVDEAQDVSGLEWEILRAHNPFARWTLLGDMNQRRTDFGDPSWMQLIDRLDLASTGVRPDPIVIERGYRSTQPILDFAMALLPRSERGAKSLQQEGPSPSITRATRQADLDELAVTEAVRLLTAYPSGTVAMIAAGEDVNSLERSLLLLGWRRSTSWDWRNGDHRLALRTPESARGVEFDGVVVVEPAAFPRNLARVGPLYTSLTRANRELAVVHHRPLPDELRRHGRR